MIVLGVAEGVAYNATMHGIVFTFASTEFPSLLCLNLTVLKFILTLAHNSSLPGVCFFPSKMELPNSPFSRARGRPLFLDITKGDEYTLILPTSLVS